MTWSEADMAVLKRTIGECPVVREVKQGFGSFLQIYFEFCVGSKEVMLWIYLSDWDICLDKRQVCSSSDSSVEAKELLVLFSNRRVKQIDLLPEQKRVEFHFDGDLKLLLRKGDTYDLDSEMIMLFRGDQHVLSLR